MSDRLHSGLSGYLERQGLAWKKERIDGAVVLNLDEQFRVYCRQAPFGDLVLESHLLALPSRPGEADEIMQQCLMASWVRMAEHADIPVLSADESEILLQQRIPSDTTIDEFEGALEQFTNSLTDWRRIFRVL
jgi:hypothetical protein